MNIYKRSMNEVNHCILSGRQLMSSCSLKHLSLDIRAALRTWTRQQFSLDIRTLLRNWTRQHSLQYSSIVHAQMSFGKSAAPAGQVYTQCMETEAPTFNFAFKASAKSGRINYSKSLAERITDSHETNLCRQSRPTKRVRASSRYTTADVEFRQGSRPPMIDSYRPSDARHPTTPQISLPSRGRKRCYDLGPTTPDSVVFRQKSHASRRPSFVKSDFNPTGLEEIAQIHYPEKDGWVHHSNFKRDECEPGTIFWALWMKPLLDSSIAVGDKQRVETQLGPLIVKKRPLVVIGVHHSHISAVPIYSYHGRGVAGLPRAQQDEHIRILNDDEFSGEMRDVVENPSRGRRPVGIDPNTTERGWSISKGSAIKFTEQENIDFKTPVRPRGRLNPECTKHLMRLMMKSMWGLVDDHERFLERMSDITNPEANPLV